MSPKIKSYIQLILPEYMILIFFTLLAGSLILSALPTSLILIFLSLSFAMFSLNIINNIIDIELDRINKPTRPLPSGKITVKSAKQFAAFCVVISFAFSYFVNFQAVLIIAAFHVISVLYSVPPFRLRRLVLADNIAGGTVYGLFPFLMLWTTTQGPLPWHFFILFGGLVFAIASTKDFEDVKGEKKTGISTLPIKLGLRNAMMFTILTILILVLMMLTLSLIGEIPAIYIYPSMASLILTAAYGLIFSRHLKPSKGIVTQSKIVTLGMITVVLIEILYAVSSM